MVSLKIYAFGSPRLMLNDRLLNLGLRKGLALIIYLAVTGRPHTRDHLATLLWPDSDQREARTRLRRLLYRLSQALGDHVLASDGNLVRFHSQVALWLDCAEFQSHVTAGLRASAMAGIVSPRVTHLTKASELYAAEFLAGFTLPDSPVFDDWQFFQRETFYQLYGQALEQLVQAYLGAGQMPAALRLARMWVALNPLHEAAQRALMRLYYWNDQYSAAIRQFHECARLVAAEFGAEPEMETTETYESIRRRALPSFRHHSDSDIFQRHAPAGIARNAPPIAATVTATHAQPVDSSPTTPDCHRQKQSRIRRSRIRTRSLAASGCARNPANR